jgi:PAS domain S-box-containing protein
MRCKLPLAQPGFAPASILNVAGDEAKRHAMSRLLSEAGYAVTEAASASEALQLAQSRPDLIVLDMTPLDMTPPAMTPPAMTPPDMDAGEICRRLKESPATATIPVLQVSHRSADDLRRAPRLETGADAFVIDPTDTAVLFATVTSLLRIRRAEEAARVWAEQWQATFDAIYDGVCLCDIGGRVVRANAAFARFAGRPAAELLGHDAGDLLGPEFSPEEGPVLAAVLRTRRRHVAEIRRGDRWFRVVVDPVYEPAEVLSGAVSIVSDITESKLADEALRDRDRRKNEFLAMLGHELRNPLAGLTYALALLGMQEVPPVAGLDVREIMDRQLRQLTHLVDDLLDVARVTQGKISLRLEPLLLSEVVGRAIAAVQPTIDSRRHQLTVRLPEEPVHLSADAIRLEQILVSVLGNAAKYTDAGGQIRLAVQREANDVAFRVTDNGAGMTPDTVARAFDLFAQAERSLDRSEGGLGIGLTMAQTLAQLHGGSITASSPGLGQGSEFVVWLPASAVS